MSRDPNPGDDTIRGAADEIRRETRAAAAEIRIELGAARRETRAALREAMDEIGSALREVWGPSPAAEPGAAARLSRAERKELTRELLLDAAIEVFAQKGYHGASLDDVAEAAGFTKGAVYSNFTRKSDLFRELLERETRRRNAALGAGMASVSVEALPEVGGEWLRRQAGEQRDWDLLTVEFWLAAVRDPALGARLSHGREQALDDFGGIIDQKLAEVGVDAGLSGRELAEVFDALGTGLLMSQYLDPASDRADLFARAARKLLAAVGPLQGRERPES
jgi:AcrR family transcriptional regulator